MGVIHRYYRPALHYCLARPKATVIAAIGGSLLLSAALVPIIGSSLFPKADTPQFLISVEAPNGTSFAETDAALRFVEEQAREACPAVKSWFANLGHGNPQIYYNHIVRKDAPNYGESLRAAQGVRHARDAAACSTSCARSSIATRARAST